MTALPAALLSILYFLVCVSQQNHAYKSYYGKLYSFNIKVLYEPLNASKRVRYLRTYLTIDLKHGRSFCPVVPTWEVFPSLNPYFFCLVVHGLHFWISCEIRSKQFCPTDPKPLLASAIREIHDLIYGIPELPKFNLGLQLKLI